jgi:hypothetical protein
MRPSHQVTRLSQFGRILWTVEYNNNRSSANNMIIIGNQEKKKKKNFKTEQKKTINVSISNPLSRTKKEKKRLRSNFKTTITFSTLANHSYSQKS